MAPRQARVLGALSFSFFGCVLAASAALAAPPKVNYLYPAGGQIGQTVAVTASGDFAKWPAEVWFDRPGLSATAEKGKGKLKIAIADDAQPGVAWMRVFDGEGASSPRPFIVGRLPEVEETEPNDAPSQCKPREPQVVVNGRLRKGGDHDGVCVSLKQGQTLVASLAAHSILGSPMDAVLQVCELVERKPVVGTTPRLEAYVVAHDHDAIGLDPQIVFQTPRDGNYLVRVFAFPSEPNSSIAYSGGDTYVYRLTLATGPLIHGALPLAVNTDKPTEVKLFGWNMEPATTTIPAAAESNLPAPLGLHFATASLPSADGSVALRRYEGPCIIEGEPASENSSQAIPIPSVVSGRLDERGDTDVFKFNAKKNVKVTFDLESRELGYPVDGLLQVLDDSGKVLVENDDSARKPDSQLTFTPPADGQYRVVVRDLNLRGGPRYFYLLNISTPTPDFALTIAADSFVAAPDKPAEIAVTIDRRAGFSQPIKIRAVGLPEGITAEEVTSQAKGDTAKTVKLVLKTTADAKRPISGPFSIEGHSDKEPAITRQATFPLNLPLSGQHYLPWATAR